MTEETHAHAHDIGGLGEEAAKLIAAAGEWWADARSRAQAGAGQATASYRSPECLVCPICQLLAILRTGKPEVFEHLLDASHSLLLAVRAAIDAQDDEWRRRRAPGMEHIDID